MSQIGSRSHLGGRRDLVTPTKTPTSSTKHFNRAGLNKSTLFGPFSHPRQPSYDPIDYNVDLDQYEDNSCNSPIGWICDATKEACREAFSVPKERTRAGNIPKLHIDRDLTCADTECSDDDIVNEGRKQLSHRNGVLTRNPASEFHAPDILVPEVKLYTPGRSLSGDPLKAPESRIVAPHVGKLASYSVIEIRLESEGQSVAILCSVDVLKMRSAFFGSILENQELTQSVQNTSGIWRDPIVIPEPSPFEAAAYLESLHEGRSLFKEEWNFCWARLSVHWVVEDLMMEYVNQIDNHINKLVKMVQANSWRTNPSVLLGYRISVFRKGPTPTPTILSGVIIDANTSTAYSKVRVAFDQGRDICLTPLTPISKDSNQPNVGEVSEPFWVQKEDGCSWAEPDDIFQNAARKLVTITDKRVFWEMVRSIIDLPQLASELKCCIKSSKDVATLLKKQEYKVLWSADAPEYLPKDAATELIQAAYCFGLGTENSSG